jgi:succinate dehydrogenase / fumarate reductase cytochrome b subunit
MNWFTSLITSSIGKKLLMALTGFCFLGFIAIHLIGNLTIYGGKDFFLSYSEHLHSFGVILKIAEFGLLFLAAIHICTGIVLFFKNLMARPARYHIKKNAGGRTLSSATMPYTGLVLLVFVIYHLIDFHFVDKSDTTIYHIVFNTFQNPLYAGIYVLAVIFSSTHIKHGFWSAFQTVGADHVKYTPLIKGISFVFSLIVGVGFGFIPIYMILIA